MTEEQPTSIPHALVGAANDFQRVSKVATHAGESTALIAYSHFLRELALHLEFCEALAETGFGEADLDLDMEELMGRFAPLVDSFHLPVRRPFSRLGWASKLAWVRAVTGKVIVTVPALVEWLPPLAQDVWEVHLIEGRVSGNDVISGRSLTAYAFMLPLIRGQVRASLSEGIKLHLSPHVKKIVAQLRRHSRTRVAVTVELTAFRKSSLFLLDEGVPGVPIRLRSTIRPGQHYTRMVSDLTTKLEQAVRKQARAVRGGGRPPIPDHAQWWALSVFQGLTALEIAEHVTSGTDKEPEDVAETVERCFRYLGLKPPQDQSSN